MALATLSNLKRSVDALHLEWQTAGVPIPSAPAQKPWGLYEFIAEDCDGNSFRVIYDSETPTKQKLG